MSPRILIVEDHLPLAQAMAQLLSRYAIPVDIAGDGVDGLKKYAADPYDLLIVGLKLPKLSGVELIRKIRSTARGKTLPIIIMTGVYKGEQYAKKARESFGIMFYLEKPFSQEAFLNAVKQSLKPGESGEAGPPAKAPDAPVKAPSETPAPKSASTERSPTPGHNDKEVVTASPRESAPKPRQVAEIQPRQAVRGNLRDRPLDQLLLESRKKRATGILFVKKGDDDRSLLMINGLPLGMRTTNLEKSFGNHLFCNGKISLMEYQIYQSRRQNGHDPDQIFIKMGCLLPDEFFAEWEKYLEESLIAMLAWEKADFTFQLWPSLPDSSPLPPVNIAHIIHQGYKRHASKDRVAAVLRTVAGKFIALTPSFYDHQMHISIDPTESVFLDGADGAHMFEDLLPGDPVEAEQVTRSLGAFMALGMIEISDSPRETEIEAPFPIRERSAEHVIAEDEEPEEEEQDREAAPEPEEASEGFDDLIDDLEDTLGDMEASVAPEAPAATDEADPRKKREEELLEFHAGLKKKNYYEMFGMKPGQFDFSRLKSEYFRLTKQWSPEHFITSSGDILEKAEEVLSALATAYNTLSNVVSKEKYDEMLASSGRAAGIPGAKDHDRMQAEVAFQSGMAFLEMADWDGAEKSLGEAMSLAPENGEIIAHYAYALYNKNKKSKVVQKRVQELLAQALKLRPKCAPAFAYRGAVLLDDDKAALAEADFKKALSINPRYRFALKGLKRIEARKQDDRKGIFSRFRK